MHLWLFFVLQSQRPESNYYMLVYRWIIVYFVIVVSMAVICSYLNTLSSLCALHCRFLCKYIYIYIRKTIPKFDVLNIYILDPAWTNPAWMIGLRSTHGPLQNRSQLEQREQRCPRGTLVDQSISQQVGYQGDGHFTYWKKGIPRWYLKMAMISCIFLGHLGCSW